MLLEYLSFVCSNLFEVFLLFSHEILSANFVGMCRWLKEFPSFSITITYASCMRFTYITEFTAQDRKQSKHGNTMQIYTKLNKFNAFYLLQLFIGIPMVLIYDWSMLQDDVHSKVICILKNSTTLIKILPEVLSGRATIKHLYWNEVIYSTVVI